MARKVTVLPGDGIGPEVVNATIKVLNATGIPFEWDWQRYNPIPTSPLGENVVRSIVESKLALKGPTATPVGEGHRSLNVTLRENFGLYANVRPVKTMAGIKTRFSDLLIDIVVFRENLEDLYVGNEEASGTGAQAIARFTKQGCRRIARYAFEYARRNGRKKVTIVHKANILKKTHGLFLDIAREVGGKYPNIACEDLIADNCFMQLIRNPERFDCLLLPNFLGDLASDICAGLVGGLGFAPGANIGEDTAVFEAVHGTAPDIAGQGIANPTAMILSGAMLLEHIGETDAARRVEKAVALLIREGRRVTKDVNSELYVSTDEFASAVATLVR